MPHLIATHLIQSLPIIRPPHYPVSTNQQFLISFAPLQPGNGGRLKQRQQANTSAQFIDSSGRAIDDCRQSSMFTLTTDGRLTNGSAIFSTSGQQDFQPFIASTTLQKDYTYWELSGDTIFWDKYDFLNGAAEFCLNQDTVEAYFRVSPSSSCTPVILAQVSSEYVLLTVGFIY